MNPSEVFRLQCALDMAMRLHCRFPGIVEEALFEALHERSVRMFELMVTSWWDLTGKIRERRRNGDDETHEHVTISSSSSERDKVVDWMNVLNGQEYAAVEVKDCGRYGDEWDSDVLRSSCKHRMEFFLNYYWRPGELRSVL